LSRALPQLHTLNAALRLEAGDGSLSFPPQLQRLHLFLSSSRYPAPDDATPLLASICQLQQLHTLCLVLEYGTASLAPLQQLPLLRDLELTVLLDRTLQQSTADLRALHWLHRLRIDPFLRAQERLAALLNALLRDAPEEELRALQWRDFAIDGVCSPTN
jgi:hypothetical protein